MGYLTTSFWNFPHHTKWDALKEPQHSHLIYAALRDVNTDIEKQEDGNYILFGDKEALLVIPSLLSTKLLLSLFQIIINSKAVMA